MSWWMVILIAIGVALLLGKVLSIIFGLISLTEFFAPKRGERAGAWVVNRAVQVAGVLILVVGAVVVVLALTNSHSGHPMTWGDAGLVIGGFAIGVAGMKIWELPEIVRKRRASERAARVHGVDEG